MGAVSADSLGVSSNVVQGSGGSFWSNFWDGLTHPISGLGGMIKAKQNGLEPEHWSSMDAVNYFRDGTLPSGQPDAGVYNSDNPDASLDATGYDQAQWEYDKQLELLGEQRAFNSAEAQKNRDWQERMSNTAYQRAVQDLEAAGLNKWLAVTGGNGASASTPSGSSATSSVGDASQPNPYLAKAMLQFGQSVIGSILKLVK